MAEFIGRLPWVWDLADAGTGMLGGLFLWVPPVVLPAWGWPLLVMSDGNAVIATAVDAIRAQTSWPSATNLGWGFCWPSAIRG